LPRIGLVYEDEQIRIALEIFLPKILGKPIETELILGGSWPGIVGKLPDLLEVLSVKHIYTPLDCVAVIVDANGSPAGVRAQRLRDKTGNRRYKFGIPIYHAIVRQIETWLLGDPEAINDAAGRHIPIVAAPEMLVDPKRHLIQVLKNHGAKAYDRKFVREVAEIADINRIAERCPGFRDFVQKLRDCRGQRELF
jgi:hypothetical protein